MNSCATSLPTRTLLGWLDLKVCIYMDDVHYIIFCCLILDFTVCDQCGLFAADICEWIRRC